MLFNIFDPENQVPRDLELTFMLTEFMSLQAAQLKLCVELKELGIPVDCQSALAFPFNPELIGFVDLRILSYRVYLNGDFLCRDSEEIYQLYTQGKFLECLRLIYIKLERDLEITLLRKLQRILKDIER